VLTISAQALGRRKPLCDPFSVPPPTALATGRPVTLRDLIAHVVRGEVAAFHTRQVERRLLKALTAAQIDDGVAAGKVSAGGSDLNQSVDPDQAVSTAVEAFTDGLFLVVVDDAEVKELDAPLPLNADSRLTFVRLTLLAGG
jgi:hypothetical protein